MKTRWRQKNHMWLVCIGSIFDMWKVWWVNISPKINVLEYGRSWHSMEKEMSESEPADPYSSTDCSGRAMVERSICCFWPSVLDPAAGLMRVIAAPTCYPPYFGICIPIYVELISVPKVSSKSTILAPLFPYIYFYRNSFKFYISSLYTLILILG